MIALAFVLGAAIALVLFLAACGSGRIDALEARIAIVEQQISALDRATADERTQIAGDHDRIRADHERIRAKLAELVCAVRVVARTQRGRERLPARFDAVEPVWTACARDWALAGGTHARR